MSEVALFTPLTIRGVTFKNRIGVSPMCMYSSEDGFFNDWHLVHLGARAIGGAALIIFEATAVEPEGRISPKDTGLWKDEHIEPVKKIVDFVKSYGSVPGIQLAHAGRKASAARPWEGDAHLKNEAGGWDTKAPSAVQFDETQLWKTPHELTVEEIKHIQEKFAQAAIRAVKAGFQIIEIHGAHGYLIHEFCSPLSNHRTDQYGGSFENRTRFLLEIVHKVRAVIPESVLLFVRLNCTDWKEGGWTVDETVQASILLKQAGVDLVDSSSGFVIPNYRDIPFGPNFQVPFSERIRKEAGIASAAVGFITEPEQANEIIESGKADIVLLARGSLSDPNFPYHAAQKLKIEHPSKKTLPSQYNHWLKH